MTGPRAASRARPAAARAGRDAAAESICATSAWSRATPKVCPICADEWLSRLSGGQLLPDQDASWLDTAVHHQQPGAGAAAWKEEMGTLQEDAGGAPITLSGVGDRAAGGGTEIGVQDGGYIIDVHGGDPSGTGAAFPKSIALAQAIIAGLH